MFGFLHVSGGRALVFSVLAIFALQCMKTNAALAQMQRQVEPPIVRQLHPVVVTRITLGAVTVQRGRFIKPVGTAQDPVSPFQADDNWVGNLTVHLLNRTNQTIVCAVLNLSFPETTNWATHFRAGYQLALGRIPSSVAFRPDGRPIPPRPDSTPILFRPGQEMAIHLGDYIDQIKKAAESVRPLAALTTMNVNLVAFYFVDGTKWSGAYEVFDPQNFTWRRTDAEYFPGNFRRNWPGQPGWVDRQ